MLIVTVQDFPREGNGESYHYARRRFDLPAMDHLKYSYLENFEQELLGLEGRTKFLCANEVGVRRWPQHTCAGVLTDITDAELCVAQARGGQDHCL